MAPLTCYVAIGELPTSPKNVNRSAPEQMELGSMNGELGAIGVPINRT